MGEDVLDLGLVEMVGVTWEGVGRGGKGVSEGGNRKCKGTWYRVIMAQWGDCRGLSIPAVWSMRLEGTRDEP